MFDFLEKIFLFENQLWKENAPGKMSELNDEKSVKDSEPVKKSRKPALPDFKNIDYKVMILWRPYDMDHSHFSAYSG